MTISLMGFLASATLLGLSAGLSPGPLLTLVISETLRSSARGGIKVALITTATGLAIAIPINIAHNYFVSRVDRIVIDMEESAQKMIDAVYAIERGAA